ncbi:hypothetical protein D3878_08425 [Noviherbaspirillum sedimenti]|uniref:Uncharacterized protein n=1 Tax=Noviherbaspirillum sedimenti TaxID=2320865 RepID=A0A3A3GH73_9BURK|nr:hypothetical protein D3878_08425 [Noviherbaspirillum sedimenti]
MPEAHARANSRIAGDASIVYNIAFTEVGAQVLPSWIPAGLNHKKMGGRPIFFCSIRLRLVRLGGAPA